MIPMGGANESNSEACRPHSDASIIVQDSREILGAQQTQGSSIPPSVRTLAVIRECRCIFPRVLGKSVLGIA